MSVAFYGNVPGIDNLTSHGRCKLNRDKHLCGPDNIAPYRCCSIAKLAQCIDWRAEGFGAGKLDYLLMQQGWFYDGHRALSDCLAGLFLLSLELPASGACGMSVLLDSARKKRFAIRAVGAPFDCKDDLRKRGYRWDPGNAEREKAWWIIVDDREAELRWLRENVFGRDVRLPVSKVTAVERFSIRVLAA